MASSTTHCEWKVIDGKNRAMCSDCHKNRAEHVALKPLLKDGEVVAQPHEYSVCHGCFVKQGGAE